MIGMALDGLWRDCCKRAVPLPVGGSEGPCPTEDLEVITVVPQLEVSGLSPTISDVEDGCVEPKIVDAIELTPTLIEDSGDDLIPSIADADTDEDC